MVSLFFPLWLFFLPQTSHLVAPSPLALAPVGTTTEVLASTAEVRSRAAETRSTLLVNNGTAGLASLSGALGGRRLSRSLLVVTFSEASLASGSAVEVLVLEVVLGSTVASGRAATVEVAVGTGTGAAHAALGVTADVDLRNVIVEVAGRRRRGGVALGRSAREGLQACLCVTVVDSGTAPTVL